MKLYEFPRAPHCRKVNILLAEKDIDIERITVSIPDKHNLEPKFLSKNPRGLLPVLELENGVFLDESLAICRFLERKFPQPELFGISDEEKTEIDCWERHMEFDGYLPATDVFRNTAVQFSNRAVAGLPEGYRAIAELAERGERRVTLFFERLEERLSGRDYIACGRFSMADITGVIAVDQAKRSGLSIPDNCHQIQRWYESQYTRNSVSSTQVS